MSSKICSKSVSFHTWRSLTVFETSVMLGVLVTFPISLTKYLTESHLKGKVYFILQFKEIQSILMRKSWWQKREELVSLHPQSESKEWTDAIKHKVSQEQQATTTIRCYGTLQPWISFWDGEGTLAWSNELSNHHMSFTQVTSPK